MDAGQIARLFPAPVAVSVATADRYDAPLYPEERQLMRRSVLNRRREFAAGRSCARAALADLGSPATAILAGPDRAPIWPVGYVGSITHCEGFCCAVAARIDQFESLGIDAEDAGQMTPAMVRLVLRPDERIRLDLLPEPPGSTWAKLAFSAKEATYKCYYPLAGRRLDFQDVSIQFTADGAFEARVDGQGKSPRAPLHFDGRWRVYGGRVYTGVSAKRADIARALSPRDTQSQAPS